MMTFSDEAELNLQRAYTHLNGSETYTNIVSSLKAIEETPVEYALDLVCLGLPEGWNGWTGDFVRYLDSKSNDPNASVVFRYRIVDVDLIDTHVALLSWAGLN